MAESKPKATDEQLDEVAQVLIDAVKRPEVVEALSSPARPKAVAS